MDVVKNPIMIGLVAGMITYMYIKWRNESMVKKNKNKKKKNKDVNLLIPLSVFILFWFISYAYFSSDSNNKSSESTFVPKKYKLTRDAPEIKLNSPVISNTSDPASFNMVSNGVHIPNHLPDIMFEMY